MLLSLTLILLITLGGTVTTYVYRRDEKLLARLAAGNIIGSTVFGLVGFALACQFGLAPFTIWTALVVTLAPLVLLANKDWRDALAADLIGAKERLDNVNFNKFLNFAYYAGCAVLFYFFFSRAMLETPNGILTGGAHNLGDLPFHLGAIFSFTEGNNFPPENPSFAYAKFTYPFMADFIAACFVKLGANVPAALLAQNVTLALSLIVLLEKFVYALTRNRPAGKIAVFLLLFSGGLGFVIFFRDYWRDGREFFEFIWHLPDDYTIRQKNWRWGNALTTLFLTQRGLLLGMPLVLIVLTKIWELFSQERGTRDEGQEKRRGTRDEGREIKSDGQRTKNELDSSASSPLVPRALPLVFIGLLAGTLPLVHVHSLAVLFVVCAFLFFFSLSKWREWFTFGAAVAAVAVPELIWTLTGSASNISKFVEPHFGWDKGDSNIFVFWAKNLGLFAPLLVVAVFLVWKTRKTDDELSVETSESTAESPNLKIKLLLFYVPFAFLFVISNFYKFAPWEWDNIKFLIYWFVGSIPFVAWLLAELCRKRAVFKIAAWWCFIGLIFAGALDVWRTISGQINYSVFSRDAVALAQQIKEQTAPNAVFLNAPTYNSPVVLTGRRSFMRYIPHLNSYGIDFMPRYDETKRMYEGSALADALLQKNQIEYVIINPEDGGWVQINEEFFKKYPLVAEAGQYRVYKIK